MLWGQYFESKKLFKVYFFCCAPSSISCRFEFFHVPYPEFSVSAQMLTLEVYPIENGSAFFAVLLPSVSLSWGSWGGGWLYVARWTAWRAPPPPPRRWRSCTTRMALRCCRTGCLRLSATSATWPWPSSNPAATGTWVSLMYPTVPGCHAGVDGSHWSHVKDEKLWQKMGHHFLVLS